MVTGARSVALAARPAMVLSTLAEIAPAMPLLHAPPALAAALEGEWPLAAALVGAVLAPLVLRRAAQRAIAPRDLRVVEALVTVAAAFLLATALSAPAFWALGMAPLDALFEAASAITTTGLSVSVDAHLWPLSGHFLRAWLQWGAGLAFLASALALIVGPGAVARRLGGAASLGDDDMLASTRRRARSLLLLYAGLTAVAVAAAAFLAESAVDGALLALAAISTGGFSPEPGSLADESRALQGAIIVACLVGAVSFPLMLGLRRRGARSLIRDPALRLSAALLAGGAAVIALIEGARGADPARAVADAAVQAGSALSTAGFSSIAAPELAPATLLILMLLMIVGGDVGSTAGGIKATRVVAALAAIRLTLDRTQAPPGAVTHLRALDQRFRGEEVAGIMAIAAVYALCATALWAGFLVAGAPALPALFDIVSALSTAGLSAGVVGPETAPALKLGVIAAMLLGRVEFFALLALFRPATWT
jgi:trk system potassium uptake protein TrkH